MSLQKINLSLFLFNNGFIFILYLILYLLTCIFYMLINILFIILTYIITLYLFKMLTYIVNFKNIKYFISILYVNLLHKYNFHIYFIKYNMSLNYLLFKYILYYFFL